MAGRILPFSLRLIRWYGQSRQNLLATALSHLALKYLVTEILSLTVTTREIPLLIFSLALVAHSVVAQTPVATPRTIRVAMDNAYAPYSFQSDEGKLQGILIDQWKAWERQTGIKAEIHAMDWGEALRRMRAGEFDVIDSIVETPERRDYFDFTPAYATIEASIFFRRDISGITDLASLKGFPVGVKAGDQHIDQLKANGATTVIPFQNNDEIIEAAKQHKINVFVIDDPSALYLLNKMGIEDEFRYSAPVFRDELRRAVRKGDAATLRAVSEGFAAIEPSEMKEIDEKWFGRAIDRWYGRYLTYAGYAVAVAILLIAGLAGWNRILRTKILERTAALGESEQRYLALFENMAEGVAYLRLLFEHGRPQDAIYLEVNPAWERLTGLRNAAGRKASEITPGIREVNSDFFELAGRVVSPGQRDRFEAYSTALKMWFSISAYCPRKGHVIVVLDDITERKQAEEMLKATSEQLRALSARLQAAREEEGTRIAREIHDELGAALTSLRWDLEGFDQGLSEAGNGPKLQELRQKIKAMMRLTDTTINTVRRICSELRPFALDEVGLTEAIEWQALQFQDRTGIMVQCDCTLENVDLSREQSTAAFRIFQEALTNILRHAQATKVNITVSEGDGEFTLTISDNGRGISENEKSQTQSLGLLGMRERAHLVGGKIDITGSEGKGTVVTLRFPIVRAGRTFEAGK